MLHVDSGILKDKILKNDKICVKGMYTGIKSFEMTNGALKDFPHIEVDEYKIWNL